MVLILDGLGAEQLAQRRHLAPTLAEMHVSTITTVAPSTTATALTSIATGVGVGEHGIVGYRIRTDDGNLNVLRWKTPQGDATKRHPPERLQPVASFGGQRPPALQRETYCESGFSRAYLRDARRHGFKMLSSLVVQARRLLAAGESFVYAYYEGLDTVAHEHGFAEHYDAELRACDRLVADLLTVLPRGTALVVTSDHGLGRLHRRRRRHRPLRSGVGAGRVGRGPVPLAARPAGERPRPVRGRRGAPTASRPGCTPLPRSSTAAGWARR